MSKDPDVIYLSPRCTQTESFDGREWCDDDAWGACEECGAPSVKYVRADTLDAPEDATKALVDVVSFLSDLQRNCVQDDPDSDVRCEHCGSDDKMIQVVADGYEHAHEPWCIVRKARELRAKLRATPEGAALIQQAEEQGHD